MVQNMKLFLVGLASTVFVSPISCVSPPAFILAGDSTTAVQNAGKTGGGWGDGFISTLFNGAGGINYGHNGATTASFVAGGDWAKVLAAVAEYKSAYTTFVTIQFGHNDQKATSNVTLEEYSTNLENMVEDVKTAGGTPILVTPLTRRSFSNGAVADSLGTQRNLTIAVANTTGSYYIDLNRASSTYVNAIGATDAATYNLKPTDFTHLNTEGSMVFGNIVSGLIGAAIGGDFGFAMDNYTIPNVTIAADVASGTYIFPSGFGTLINNTFSS
ncbi:hypothetical protein NHQ30_002791 [Ciborinia camelliae]|nr:hypothetical protein NHQ30_002791 [Ciborinia camelliae]